MKKILLAALIVASANAFECSIADTQGTTYKTMIDTYKFDGDIASMWFESKTIVKNKVVETGKFKKEALKDKMMKTVQSISYKRDGSVKNSYDGRYDNHEEVIPKTAGEWMWNILRNGGYLFDDIKDKNNQKMRCEYLGIGWVPSDENGTIIEPKYGILY